MTRIQQDRANIVACIVVIGALRPGSAAAELNDEMGQVALTIPGGSRTKGPDLMHV